MAIWLAASPTTSRCCPSHRCGVLPGPGEGADDEGLAGAGRADQRLDAGAGGEHAADGGGLVRAELDPGLGQPGHERGRGGCVLRAGAPRRMAAGAQDAFAAHMVGGGVQRARRACRRPTGRRPAAARPAPTRRPGASAVSRTQWPAIASAASAVDQLS